MEAMAAPTVLRYLPCKSPTTEVRVRALALLVAASATMAPALGAQSLNERLLGLFSWGACGSPLCLDVDPSFHGQHYIPGAVGEAQRVLNFIPGAIASSLGQIPFTAANSGTVLAGFEGGVPVFESVSGGPILGERAQTLGQGTYFVGLNVSGINLSSMRGIGLDELRFRFPHQNVQDAALGSPVFEHDVIDVELDMELSFLVAALSAAYGLSDRVDIGVLVPFVSASMSGSSLAVITNPFGQVTGAHQFESGSPYTARSSVEGSASGIGDIGVRLKANLHQTASLGVGATADVRLPVGSENDFLGTGGTSVRILGLISGRTGDWAPHLNAGMVVRTGDVQTNTIQATVGADRLVNESLTFVAEVRADLQLGDSGLEIPEPISFTAPSVLQIETTNIPVQNDHLADASVGFKFQTGSNLRVVGNVLIPLLDGGVRPAAMWTVGLERVF